MENILSKPTIENRYRVDIRREDVDKAIEITGQPTGSSAVRMLLSKAFSSAEANTDVIQENTKAVKSFSENVDAVAEQLSTFLTFFDEHFAGSKENSDSIKKEISKNKK